MTIFVDGPDGVGKTGYSKYVASQIGWPRIEMRPVDNTACIEAKAAVFNTFIRDLHAQGVNLVVDRGSVSSIVYSRIFDRGHPEHAWTTLEAVKPTIIYLSADPEELAIRYDDELYTSSELREIATAYDEAMEEAEKLGCTVTEIDTSCGAVDDLLETVYRIQEERCRTT